MAQKIILYSTNCPKCKQLERKLNSLNIEFEITNDIQKLIDLGFRSAPVLQIDDKFYEFSAAWKKAEELA